jgi:hypothetical protein
MTSEDPIVDRSNAQKEMRVQELREELMSLGYSVVPTKDTLSGRHAAKEESWTGHSASEN